MNGVEFAFEDHRFGMYVGGKIADTTQRELYGMKVKKWTAHWFL